MVTAKSLGLPYLSAYLDSLGTNFTHGANFATYASTIRLPTSIIPAGTYSPIYLDVEYSEFVQFKFRSQVIRKKGKMGQWVNTSLVLNIGYCSSWELRVLITNICITKWIFTLYWAFDFLVWFSCRRYICIFIAQGVLFSKSFIHIRYWSEWSCWGDLG